MLGHVVAAILLLLISLAIGMAGYMHFENLPALDAFLDASMLLSGMGPFILRGPKQASSSRACSRSTRASSSSLAALVLAPLLHRILHRFHWDRE